MSQLSVFELVTHHAVLVLRGGGGGLVLKWGWSSAKTISSEKFHELSAIRLTAISITYNVFTKCLYCWKFIFIVYDVFQFVLISDYFGIKRLCPTNVTKLTPKDVNATHSEISWSDLTLTECGYNLSRSHVPGEAFPVGATEVLYIFRGDKFVYRLCTFYVHVIEANERETGKNQW